MIHQWIIALHPNEVGIFTAIVGGLIALFVAMITIITAFCQIRKQFENNAIYVALKDFQSKLFSFSSAIGFFSVEILNLKYFLKSQYNPLINKGNMRQFRFDIWKKFTDIHLEMQKTYIDYLVSFETHEVLFLSLKKMQTLFATEMKAINESVFMDFTELIFPEMYGKQNILTPKQLENVVDDFYKKVSNVQVYLQDIRIELQNETLGKILGKSLEIRKSKINNQVLKVLTKKGWLV